MSETSAQPGPASHDEELLADLFDSLLQEILDGRTPDLAALLPDRPDLRPRIHKAWALACSVAGRREPGRPAFGGYEILRELGHGGMGTVYLARHQTLQRDVAIKVLPQSLAMSPRAKQRFLEEARALAQIRHDNVVHIHRVVDHAEMLAFEMEFIDGRSLQDLLVELRREARPQAIGTLSRLLGIPAEQLGSRSSAEWFVRIAIRIARALDEVHRAGLVHRDVKPGNILLRRNGTPMLADFGLVLQSAIDGQTTKFAGTPVYAAPERLRGDGTDTDARTDVYSLGVTLYESLSLAPPFKGSSTHEVLRRIETGKAPPLRSRAPHVSRDLATIVAKAMEPDPRHRYASAAELADDLERLLDLQPIQATPAGPVRRAVKFVRRNQKIVLTALVSTVLVASMLFPAVALATAREQAAQAAAAAHHAARSHLLQQECTPTWWRSEVSHSLTVQQHTRLAARQAGLQDALADYDRALASTPDDKLLRLERAAVAAAASNLDAITAKSQLPERGDSALLDAMAQALATARPLVDVAQPGLAAASPEERFAAGLFAFLVGDSPANRACWQDLGPRLGDDPLVDACTALRLVADNAADRAYPRVFHAAKAFPDASALMVALADGALIAGDIDIAQRWHSQVPVSPDPALDARRRLLAADLLAAAGRDEDARREYLVLQRADPGDPEPMLRLAQLALRTNHNADARRLLLRLLQRWPAMWPARRTLARLELQCRRVPAFLQLVRDAAEVCGEGLRGTEPLHLLALAGLGLPSSGEQATSLAPRVNEPVSLGTFLPAHLLSDIPVGLEVVTLLDRIWALAAAIDPRPIGSIMFATAMAAARLPQVASTLPSACRGLLIATPLLWATSADVLAGWLLPYQRILGDPTTQVRPRRMFGRTLPDGVFYGLRMLATGDLDGDNLPELIIAAPSADGAAGNGFVEIRSSADGALLRTLSDASRSTAFGRAVADLGDIDGDLCNDILIGAPKAILAGDPARVELRSGRNGEVLWTLADDQASFGVALVSTTDQDGDGLRDFLIGITPTALTAIGHVQLRSGRDGRILRDLTAPNAGTWFGGAVDCADVNGDGVLDPVVGGNFGGAPGMVVAFDGATRESLWIVREDDRRRCFGSMIAALPDIDHDGCAEIAVSAPGLLGNNTTPGSVLILCGRNGKCLTELRGDRGGEQFGWSICPLADWQPGIEAIAIGARRGGPIGNGYVRVFELARGIPLQTVAGGGRMFAISTVDIGDNDDDGYRDLALMTIGMPGQDAVVTMVSFAPIAAGQPR